MAGAAHPACCKIVGLTQALHACAPCLEEVDAVLYTLCRAEAAALLGSEHLSAADAALRLGPLCSLVAITDGANGSCLSALGRLQVRLPALLFTCKPALLLNIEKGKLACCVIP